jgi:CHAT domain
VIRVLINVSGVPGEGWQATISSPVLDAPIVRPISRLDGAGCGFPVVPAEDLPAGLAAEARELATASDPAVIDDVRVNIATRQPAESDIAAFGAYLHAVLLGRRWATIVAKAAGRPLELALRWPVAEWELARLPWEMMYVPDPVSGKWSPIAWNAAITRLVPGPPEQETRVHVSPKVLFVVGTDLNDVSIRPGAEFFTVWERLQQEKILFDFRVLQRASGQQIEDEIESFRPSIVHFICHGDEADDAGHIDLVSTDPWGRQVTDRRNAQQCLDLLRSRTNGYPPIVVLSACYSGSQADPVSARVDAPLAAALVQGGVPIVVGMGGQVSDLACRLFARRFYEALLRKQPVTDATAEGRRAGMKHGSNPSQSVDWALPMLFLADRLDPAVDIDASEVAGVTQRAERARQLRGQPNPAAFCDRIDVMKAQRALMDSKEPVQVLVLEETDYEPDPLLPAKWGKFGKTRVLREIAARAALGGHLPCLLTFTPGDVRPTSAEKLLFRLTQAVRDAAKVASGAVRFDSELRKLNALIAAPGGASAENLHASVRDEYEMWRISGDRELAARVIGEAMRVDLRALAELGRTELESADLQVVVLVDDVHQFDVAARTFIELIGPDGLGEEGQPAPVVFAFSSQPQQPGYQSSISLLKKFVEDNSQGSFLDYFSLERFRSSEPEPFSTPESLRRDPLALVYHQYLMHLRPGIVLHPRAKPEEVQWFLDEIHQKVLGVPSRLEVTVPRQGVQDFIDQTLRQQQIFKEVRVIDQIDDERALTEFRGPTP